MTPLEYMQTIKDKTLAAIEQNEFSIEKMKEQLTEAEEYKGLLSDYAKNCDEVIAMLEHETPPTV